MKFSELIKKIVMAVNVPMLALCLVCGIVLKTDVVCAAQAEAASSSGGSSTALIAIIVLLIVAVGVVIYMMNKTLKPISQLVEASKKVLSGDVNVDLGISESDVPKNQVQELQLAFLKMAKANAEQGKALERIAEGDLNLQVKVRSEKDITNISLNKVIDTLKDLVDEANKLTYEATVGNTSYRGDAEKFKGGYKDVIDGINSAVGTAMENMGAMTVACTMMSQGILEDVSFSGQGDYQKMAVALQNSMNSIRSLVEDSTKLAEEARANNLEYRANIDKYSGQFRDVMAGINNTIDVVADKTVWYNNILDRIPMPIGVLDQNKKWTFVNDYKAKELLGENGYKERKGSLYGTLCDADTSSMVEGLLTTGNSQTRVDKNGKVYEAVVGELKDKNGNNSGYVTVHIDITSIENVIRFTERQVERVGDNLRRLAVGDFNVTEFNETVNEYTKDVAEQFRKIDDSLEHVKSAVEELAVDAARLVDASVRGELDTRIDTSGHEGEYKHIAEGFNKTLDAVLEPINEAAMVLNEVSEGNLNILVTGNYQGQHAMIKEALNFTINYLKETIDEIAHVLKSICDGDLTVKLEKQHKGDFIRVSDSLKEIIVDFNAIMGNINEASSQVASGARQLSEGAQILATGATQQASSIEELTASVTEIAEQTRQNAKDADDANNLSNRVKENAEKGNVQMQDMLASMKEINDSSANISKIIKVIDDIAFQTNILALNAAVEAARAGVHGKGFAVVAEEVRNLAAKSAQAASETTTLIEGSISKVEAGTKIANETAEALADIVNGIEKTAEIIARIANASNQQASSVAEINTGLDQVSQVVQSNSATAQQSAASSEELNGQADVLKSLVAKFKIESGMSRIEAPKAIGMSSMSSNVGRSRSVSLDDSDMSNFAISLDFNSGSNDKY